MDRARRAENKALQVEDDNRLTGPHQLRLFNKSYLSPAQRPTFSPIRQNGLKTARAWAIQQEFRWFWRHVHPMSTETFLRKWYARGRALPPPACH